MEAKLAVFRLRFLERCRDDLSALESIGIADLSRREELVALAHRISGSAGIFGEASLGERAFILESLLLSEPEAGSDRVGAAHEVLLAMLREIVSR